MSNISDEKILYAVNKTAKGMVCLINAHGVNLKNEGVQKPDIFVSYLDCIAFTLGTALSLLNKEEREHAINTVLSATDRFLKSDKHDEQ